MTICAPPLFPLRKTNFCTCGKREQGLDAWTPLPLLTHRHRWYLREQRMSAEGCGLFPEPPLSQLENPSTAICKPNGGQWMDQEQRDKTCIWESTLAEILEHPDGQVQPLRELLQQEKLKISWKGGTYYTGMNSNELMWTHGPVGLHIDEILESCLVRPLNSFSRQTRDHFQLVLAC